MTWSQEEEDNYEQKSGKWLKPVSIKKILGSDANFQLYFLSDVFQKFFQLVLIVTNMRSNYDIKLLYNLVLKWVIFTK